jgi:hypothetical protein
MFVFIMMRDALTPHMRDFTAETCARASRERAQSCNFIYNCSQGVSAQRSFFITTNFVTVFSAVRHAFSTRRDSFMA